MKRSKRNLHLWLNETYRFQESVIHVENYLHLIKDELNQIERELLFFKGGVLQLFNEKFYTYKIQFVEADRPKPSEHGILEGKINRENIVVYIDDQFFFYTEKENLDVFKYLVKDLCVLLSHELVHRGQYYVRQGDKLNFFNFDGNTDIVDLEYMRNPQEVMAYAYMYIESLRYSNFTNDDIIRMLKTGNFARSQSLHISFYINEMKRASLKTYQLFRKYIYNYLVDPVRYDLKVI